MCDVTVGPKTRWVRVLANVSGGVLIDIGCWNPLCSRLRLVRTRAASSIDDETGDVLDLSILLMA